MKTLLLLPFLLGFYVPVFASACGNKPNGWEAQLNNEGDPSNDIDIYYLMVKNDTSKSDWGVWMCDSNNDKSEWNIKDVDCDTANAKYIDKVGYGGHGGGTPQWCEENGYS